ncbi:MAG: Fic family protein [Myxococcota bacterium]
MAQLPVEIQLTSEIVQILSEVDEFKGRFSNAAGIPREKLNLLRKVATIESIGSSTRIEGVKLTDQEIAELLERLDLNSFKNRDEEEVAGYAEAINLVYESYQELRLTENYVRQLHARLLQYVAKDQRHRGDYKKFSNHVEAFDADGKSIGVVFETATPFDTPRAMKDLVDWARDHFEDRSMHPLVVIAIFTVHFLAIHPFQDGNGRLSRILTTLLLLKSGYEYVPYSSLETVIEANKDRYYIALRRTQGTLKGDEPVYDPWLRFFFGALQKQKRNLEAKFETTLKTSSLPELSEKIHELSKQKERLTMHDIELAIDAPKSSIKFHLKKLVAGGSLDRHGQGRGVWYSQGSQKSL